MADNEMNRAAEQMTEAMRESYRALASGAVSAQDRNTRFFLSLFESGSDLLRGQAENNQTVARSLLEQSRRQQDAFRTLSQGWFDAYANLLNAPTSAYRRGVEAAGRTAQQGIEAAGRVAQTGAQAGEQAVQKGAQQAQRGVEAAQEGTQEAAENAGQAGQQVAEAGVEAVESSVRGEAATPPEQVAAEQADGEDDSGAVDATVAAVEKARELGVDLSTIEGTGSGGRIVIGDVVVAAQGSRNGG